MNKWSWIVLVVIATTARAESSIEFRQQADPQFCQLVQKETCSTNSRDGLEHCQAEHRKQADKYGANVVVTGETTQNRHKKRMANGLYDDFIKTRMEASYYRCGDQPVDADKPVKQTRPMPLPADAGSLPIEKRLQRLQSLRDKGLISEQEYQQKRQQIIDQL
ncbi:SHOCT domain-containing protein [Oceanobacter mangrovi]|uniref:SHOCT domain-containing protein n=1 Tax=Oceanobacter mangrovi TaxID=2862510 RepID=UPI001C8DFD23|nr:SHOCT domain-containing protein [Oceanobacter mangrovi]